MIKFELEQVNKIKQALRNYLDATNTNFEIVTQDDITRKRKIRAEINKSLKQINRKRIDYKKDFDNFVKDITKEIDLELERIDEEIAQAVDNLNNQRRLEIAKKLGSMEGVLFDKIGKLTLLDYFSKTPIGRYTEDNWEDKLESEVIMLSHQVDLLNGEQLEVFKQTFDIKKALEEKKTIIKLEVLEKDKDKVIELLNEILKDNELKGEIK